MNLEETLKNFEKSLWYTRTKLVNNWNLNNFDYLILEMVEKNKWIIDNAVKIKSLYNDEVKKQYYDKVVGIDETLS